MITTPGTITTAPAHITGARPKPDPKFPDTLGWREWIWHESSEKLRSSSQGTEWVSDTLTAHYWDEADVIRGVAGIHALLVPRHWKVLHELGYSPIGNHRYQEQVTGIVERFGKYVLGTDGWRAEQVVIRELMAPSTEIGLKLEQRYPNVIVHYPDQQEGESKWTLAKSSELEKGSRSLLPSSQPAPVAQSFNPAHIPSPVLQALNHPSRLASPKKSRLDPETRVAFALVMVALVCPLIGLLVALARAIL